MLDEIDMDEKDGVVLRRKSPRWCGPDDFKWRFRHQAGVAYLTVTA